ncbi:hypothetical protein Psch_03838 [Pelotomaculum schinkii]|uniref:Thioredoxin-like fold domain-containing protein n=1 Tax=Pelotomaculum schinkii TaxID=78350 RepID=A0A4Y7R7X4_9FIRM|nr:thioredoxin family protein [Pelotomaculum schinkii]TEB05075.1 hypothetical protein Psch_03838 [Pelotomaculum schinkii]
MEIKVLGTGCAKCKELHKRVTELNSEMGIEADVKKVEKMDDIIAAGIMITPALIINGKIKAVGKVPGKDALKKYIEEEI